MPAARSVSDEPAVDTSCAIQSRAKSLRLNTAVEEILVACASVNGPSLAPGSRPATRHELPGDRRAALPLRRDGPAKTGRSVRRARVAFGSIAHGSGG